MERRADAAANGGAPASDSRERYFDLLKSGLLPSWTEDPAKAQRLIDCRPDTVATSGPIRGAFKTRHRINGPNCLPFIERPAGM